MKRFALSILLVVAVGLVFSGFSLQAGAGENLGRLEPVKIEISCDEFRTEKHVNKSVRLAEHGRLEVTLCSNPSTGYQWSDSAQISDHTVLWQTSHVTLPSGSSALGAPGKERWVFQGLNEGKSTIALEYGRSWESGSGEWSLRVDVTVVDEDEEPSEKGSGDDTGEKLVREVFRKIKNSDIAALEKMMAEEFQAVHDFGASDRKGEVETLKGIELEEYRLGNFKTTRREDILIVTYTVKAEETIKGEEVEDEPVPRLSVFVNTDSGWKWIAHANLSSLKKFSQN